jgi:hypothetical protein
MPNKGEKLSPEAKGKLMEGRNNFFGTPEYYLSRDKLARSRARNKRLKPLELSESTHGYIAYIEEEENRILSDEEVLSHKKEYEKNLAKMESEELENE